MNFHDFVQKVRKLDFVVFIFTAFSSCHVCFWCTRCSLTSWKTKKVVWVFFLTPESWRSQCVSGPAAPQVLGTKKEGIVWAGGRTDLSSAPVMWREAAKARRMCWMRMTQLWRRHVTLRAIDRKESGSGKRAVDSCRQSATPLTFLC